MVSIVKYVNSKFNAFVLSFILLLGILVGHPNAAIADKAVKEIAFEPSSSVTNVASIIKSEDRNGVISLSHRQDLAIYVAQATAIDEATKTTEATEVAPVDEAKKAEADKLEEAAKEKAAKVEAKKAKEAAKAEAKKAKKAEKAKEKAAKLEAKKAKEAAKLEAKKAKEAAKAKKAEEAEEAKPAA